LKLPYGRTDTVHVEDIDCGSAAFVTELAFVHIDVLLSVPE